MGKKCRWYCAIVFALCLCSCNNSHSVFSSFSDKSESGIFLFRIMSLVPILQRYEYPLEGSIVDPEELRAYLILFLVYTDGSIREISSTELKKMKITCEEKDFNTFGEKHITVIYQDISARFIILRRDTKAPVNPQPNPGDTIIDIQIGWE